GSAVVCLPHFAFCISRSAFALPCHSPHVTSHFFNPVTHHFPYSLTFRVHAYGEDTNKAAPRTRAQTTRSHPVQSRRRPGSQAPGDNGEIRSRVVADVVDRRRLLLHSA